MAAEADGDFVAVWSMEDGIAGQRYASSGAPRGTQFEVSRDSESLVSHAYSALATDADGDFVVVWKSYPVGSDDGDVFAERLTEGEVAVSLDGMTLTTDREGDGATPEDPVETTVTGPNSGSIGIRELRTSGPPPQGFQLIGRQVVLYAPDATATDPLVIVFELDASLIPMWQDQSAIKVSKNGFGVRPCTGTSGVAYPDPCEASRIVEADGDIEITILTSTASDWTFALPGCAAPAMCPAAPATGCTVPGKSLLLVKDDSPSGPSAGDKLVWKWLKGSAADFTDPIDTADYALCLYGGATPSLVMSASVAAGVQCKAGSCWEPLGTVGYKYKDKTGCSAGLTRILLKGGTDGKAKIIVKGKDANLPVPALPLDDTSEVIAQLHDGAKCWEAVYAPADVIESGSMRYKAKSNP